ncbi:MAG TPA: LysR family transcriptional regulator, partial [Dehalococcoidia bacterium]|nr:LysR family transcriptional regulator [Dehalococcoidia bacterium]
QAAETLGSDQPAVSRRIRELEEMLGQALFLRLGGPRGVALTPAGGKLLELTASTVEELMRLPERFEEEMSHDAPPEVKVIGGQQLLLSLLAPALFAYQERRPTVTVTVGSALKPEVLEGVRSGNADIGLTSATRIPPDLAYDEVLSDRLVLIVPGQHELATSRKVTLEQVEPYPVLVPDVHSSTRKLVEEAFRSLDRTMRVGMDLQRWEVIREFVALGLGIAVVPGFVAQGLSGVMVVELDFPFPPRSYGILTARTRHLTRPARELIEAVRSEAPTSPSAARR